ncbi:hypothetical protein DUT91_23080 [Phyllobacterium salinisoli]|uniref:Uncharacterized protein n=1 Tax=Phyllobacterium salinisoli TaxID=1899321 RepID=A0A368JXB2_9HYPH|nr:hypothetical protein [Phyllobacterium salinisoli]RCS21591.1 hypothetical protein DUT91_23080 [Phyllobacterium salinisoli]
MPPTADEPKLVHLVVADVWKDKDSEPTLVHLLLTGNGEDDLVTTALNILAGQGYEEAELLELGTLSEEPEEEPHLSAWKTALGGEAALIEFDE